MRDEFERVSAVLVADPPRPAPSMEALRARGRQRSRRRAAALTVPAVVVLVGGLVAVAELRDRDALVGPVGPPATSLVSSTSVKPATSVPDTTVGPVDGGVTGWPFDTPSASELELDALLGVGDGWSIVSAATASAPESQVTIQRWVVASQDPLRYDVMFEVIVSRSDAGSDAGSEIEFTNAFGDSFQAIWSVGDSTIVAHVVGMSAEQAHDFADALVQRTDDPMDGFDAPADRGLVLLEESIAESPGSVTVTTVSVELIDTAGVRAMVSVSDRPGLPLLTGVGHRRIALGDHVAAMSPPDLPGLQLDWTTGTLQISVSSTGDTQRLARSIASQAPDQWATYLRAASSEPVDFVAVSVAVVNAAHLTAQQVADVASRLHAAGLHVHRPVGPAASSDEPTAVYHSVNDVADTATKILRLLGINDPDVIRPGRPPGYDTDNTPIVVLLGTDYDQHVDAASDPCTFTVMPGDTPDEIANTLGVPVEDLRDINPNVATTPDDQMLLVVGNSLRVPTSGCEPD